MLHYAHAERTTCVSDGKKTTYRMHMKNGELIDIDGKTHREAVTWWAGDREYRTGFFVGTIRKDRRMLP